MQLNESEKKRLFWAGFMAILAAGVGFAIRGGIFDNWGGEYHFTATQLGAIGGAGFTGFCFGIILGGVVVDKIGYGKLIIAAFTCHIVSAFVTFGASSPDNAYQMLTWGMFIFAFANGLLEAVANPLVATLYPEKRTHYLNLLHASWPAGMIIGAVIGWVLDDKMHVSWKIQLSIYLIPTVLYGIMFFRQKFPKSEAAIKGANFSEMFKDVGIIGAAVVCYLLTLFCAGPLGLNQNIAYAIGGGLLIAVGCLTKFSLGSFLLFFLFIAHAMVGAVELGTDGWIQNITGNLFTSEEGKYLFLWTSAIMFGLRFCAGFIEEKLKISPVALLFICSILATIGLQLASGMQTFTAALFALGIYAVGKTFFWPTMLAVVGDRFPQSGAVAMSIMGGIGMLSAGLIGGPGLGFGKDNFSAKTLESSNPALYESVKAEKPSKFLFFEVNAIDGGKLAEAKKIVMDSAAAKDADPVVAEAKKVVTDSAAVKDAVAAIADVKPAAPTMSLANAQAIVQADQMGDRKTLKADSFIPAAMAIIYLLMMIYFKTKGGYKTCRIEDSH